MQSKTSHNSRFSSLKDDDYPCYSGFLSFEEVEGSDVFVRRFFVLDKQNGRLEYFIDHRPVSDASSARSKLQNGFYIVVSGERRFFNASSNEEKLDWMRKLQDASKITVSLSPTMPQRNCCRVEIVGGVAHMTSLDETSKWNASSYSSSDSLSGLPTRQDTNFVKDGYCIKLGGIRKNWKRRYFVLDANSLSYYTGHQEGSLLRTIRLTDIVQARVSIGIHLNKPNVFEVVTPMRVFYLQVDSSTERDVWIKTINDTIVPQNVPKWGSTHPDKGNLDFEERRRST